MLRGIAVLLVLGRHLPFRSLEDTGVWTLPLQLWHFVGWMGVDLFFVLSGFLVSGILFREYQLHGRVELTRFFLRRGIRIYVPFYAFLVPSLLLRMAHLQADRLAVEFLFLQSYFSRRAIWNHTWTLAVEEHFYIFLGLLIFVLFLGKSRSNPFRGLLPVAAVLSAGCLFLRTLLPYDSPQVFVSSHLRFDGLFFGVVLSYFYHFYRGGFSDFVNRSKPFLYAALFVGFAPPFFLQEGYRPWMSRGGFTCLYLAFGSILAFQLVRGDPVRPPGPIAAFFAAMGKRSYSVYLWHTVAREPWLGFLPLGRRTISFMARQTFPTQG